MAQRYRPVPADSYVSSPFGARWGTQHRGTDFGRAGGSANMAVYAAQGGTVIYAGAASGFGGPDPAGWVVIDHPTADGSGTTVYGHIIRQVSVGDRVEAGQQIGRVNPVQGTNGGVAPHLHFEVHPSTWSPGSQLDPVKWLGSSVSPGEVKHATPVGDDILAPGVIAGVDVSEHQNGMSLKRAASEGMSFAIIRTTDGTHRDKFYRSHLDDAEAAGLVTAAYHYLRNPSEGTSVEQQVNAALDVMGDARRPVWIDVETPAGLHVSHIRECQARFESAGVRVIGAYSYVPYWEHNVAPAEPDSHEFGEFWVAAYGSNDLGTPADLYRRAAKGQWNYPLGNQLPALWQYGSRGTVAGHAVDINAYRGTREELRTLFYGETVPVVVLPKPELDVPATPAPGTRPILPEPGVAFTELVAAADRAPDAPAAPPIAELTFTPPGVPPTTPRGPNVSSSTHRNIFDLFIDTLVSLFMGTKGKG